ncbi:hypothetical protein B0A49_01679 [Cryomyces minteri]|uniref:Uncharacterized protein n=1 Tax=Cryomyces minteri TaxID=331657 RepID=A0A4U0XR74_9PEZI|nr:hypothetical protein B0A49_01679 [Cryomyces minteri]
MRTQRTPSPLLLLLLPAFVPPFALANNQLSTPSHAIASRDATAPSKDYTAVGSPSPVPASSPKPYAGTKDAPVDGLDGKPHAGPFVDTTPDDPPIASSQGASPAKKPVPTTIEKIKEASAVEGWESIPEKNDGVMDDTNRRAPKKGTTGTEGGVSEKDRDRKAQEELGSGKVEKRPDPPKEAPPLPHSEQGQKELREKGEQVQKEKDEIAKEKPKGAVGLETPADLPDRPHDIPHPAPNAPTLPNPKGADTSKSTPDAASPHHTMPDSTGPLDDPEDGLIQPLHSYLLSLTMILFSEVGTATAGRWNSAEKIKEASAVEGWESIPEKNDGVMDDTNRRAPKKGTTGTEGGVSEKDRDRKAQEELGSGKVEKRPDPPKEAPPLPHSEQGQKELREKGKQVQKEKDEIAKEKPKGAVGLETPADLPDRPHDIPHPAPNAPTLPNPKGADTSKSTPDAASPHHTMPDSTGPLDDPEDGLIQPLHSYLLSLTMILFSEVGDKTFLVAALMAMRHPRLVVFTAAFSALVLMTVLSAVLGHAVPTLLPRKATALAAAVLFLVFGAKMLREGLRMSKEEGVGEEMREVEQELQEKEHEARKTARRHSAAVSPYMLESGLGSLRRDRSNSRLPAPPRSPSSSPERSPSPSRSSISGAMAGLNNLLSLLLSPAWVQTFIMTFLGEWGDRSQIATIAMAAGQDYWWVTGGAISGHAVCTAAAVIGGRAVAGRVSLRMVTLGGAFAFLAFGLIYLLEAAYSD